MEHTVLASIEVERVPDTRVSLNGYNMENLLYRLITLTLLPIRIFSYFAGIVGGIWLLFLGAWKIVGLGIILSMVFPFIYAVAMLIISPFTVGGVKLLEKKQYFLGKTLAWVGMFIQHCANLYWVSLVLSPVYNASVSSILIPYILFAWFVAVSPFQYMAQSEPSDSLGTFVGLYLVQISYFILISFFFLGIASLAVPFCILLIIFAEILLMRSINHLTSSPSSNYSSTKI